MIPSYSGNMKLFVLFVALLIFTVILLVLKIFRKQSIRSMIRNERIFVFSSGLALVLLVLVFLGFFIINNRD